MLCRDLCFRLSPCAQLRTQLTKPTQNNNNNNRHELDDLPRRRELLLVPFTPPIDTLPAIYDIDDDEDLEFDVARRWYDKVSLTPTVKGEGE